MHVNACLLPGKKEEAKLTVTNDGSSHFGTVTNLLSNGFTLALLGMQLAPRRGNLLLAGRDEQPVMHPRHCGESVQRTD